MSQSNWKWILDMNPLPKLAGNEWTRDLKKGEHILWACANPACKDASGKRTVFDRGVNLRGSEFCPRCEKALQDRAGCALDPELQREVDEVEGRRARFKMPKREDGSRFISPLESEDTPEAQSELYRWKRERINPKLASRWLDLFKE